MIPIEEIIDNTYPKSSSKYYLKIVSILFINVIKLATTGNVMVQNNFPNNINSSSLLFETKNREPFEYK